ncbi:XkdW family protein [Bacillus atrophaeus]|uniref:XkdW family protein n=1 Tax=Bacillus atrophaeus TaxID=1452 RepID=UPI003F5A60C3
MGLKVGQDVTEIWNIHGSILPEVLKYMFPHSDESYHWVFVYDNGRHIFTEWRKSEPIPTVEEIEKAAIELEEKKNAPKPKTLEERVADLEKQVAYLTSKVEGTN